jgi:hypothetical protein
MALSGRAEGKGLLLLVEDEESVRRFVARVLGMRGYRVLQAKNGEEGLRLERPIGQAARYQAGAGVPSTSRTLDRMSAWLKGFCMKAAPSPRSFSEIASLV